MICFCWSGLPQYAARCIRAVADSTDERVAILATRPKVPIQGMDKICGGHIIWVEANEKRSLRDLLGQLPRCIFLSGWNVKAFCRYRDEVRSNGGTAVVMCDSYWSLSPVTPLSWRWWWTVAIECAKSVRFRLWQRHKYTAFFTPGQSGVRLLRFYGAPRGRILTGMYTADDTLFFKGKPLHERDRKIIYVGQFIERKNVLRLARAFINVNASGAWTLDMYGSGPLRGALEELAKVEGGGRLRIHDFLQPEELAAKYREARVFCLPSHDEHWGLVVHEAALSGCVLLLSNKIGAAADLLASRNGMLFMPRDIASLENALHWAFSLTDDQLNVAQEESVRLAAEVSINKFVQSVKTLIQ